MWLKTDITWQPHVKEQCILGINLFASQNIEHQKDAGKKMKKDIEDTKKQNVGVSGKGVVGVAQRMIVRVGWHKEERNILSPR